MITQEVTGAQVQGEHISSALVLKFFLPPIPTESDVEPQYIKQIQSSMVLILGRWGKSGGLEPPDSASPCSVLPNIPKVGLEVAPLPL